MQHKSEKMIWIYYSTASITSVSGILADTNFLQATSEGLDLRHEPNHTESRTEWRYLTT